MSSFEILGLAFVIFAVALTTSALLIAACYVAYTGLTTLYRWFTIGRTYELEYDEFRRITKGK